MKRLLILFLLLFSGCILSPKETTIIKQVEIPSTIQRGILTDDIKIHDNIWQIKLTDGYQEGAIYQVLCGCAKDNLWREPDWWVYETGYILIVRGGYAMEGYIYIITTL